MNTLWCKRVCPGPKVFTSPWSPFILLLSLDILFLHFIIILFLISDVPDVLPPYEYSGKLEVSESKAEVTAGEEESVLESSALDSTVADDSSMMLEVDMEDAD